MGAAHRQHRRRGERRAASAACCEIEVRYRVRSTNTFYNLVYPFYLQEGRDTRRASHERMPDAARRRCHARGPVLSLRLQRNARRRRPAAAALRSAPPLIAARAFAQLRDALAANRAGYTPEWSAALGQGDAGERSSPSSRATSRSRPTGSTRCRCACSSNSSSSSARACCPRSRRARRWCSSCSIPRPGDATVPAGTRVAAVLPPPAPSLDRDARDRARRRSRSSSPSRRSPRCAASSRRVYSIDPQDDVYADHSARASTGFAVFDGHASRCRTGSISGTTSCSSSRARRRSCSPSISRRQRGRRHGGKAPAAAAAARLGVPERRRLAAAHAGRGPHRALHARRQDHARQVLRARRKAGRGRRRTTATGSAPRCRAASLPRASARGVSRYTDRRRGRRRVRRAGSASAVGERARALAPGDVELTVDGVLRAHTLRAGRRARRSTVEVDADLCRTACSAGD